MSGFDVTLVSSQLLRWQRLFKHSSCATETVARIHIRPYGRGGLLSHKQSEAKNTPEFTEFGRRAAQFDKLGQNPMGNLTKDLALHLSDIVHQRLVCLSRIDQAPPGSDASPKDAPLLGGATDKVGA